MPGIKSKSQPQSSSSPSTFVRFATIWKMCFMLIALHALPILATAQTATIHGTIRSNDQSLPAVNIVLSNANFAATSNEKGNYEINNVPYGEYKIVVSFVGYETVEKNIKVSQGRVQENFILSESSYNLNEIVVQTQRQSFLQQQKPIVVASVDIKDVITQNTLLTDVADRIAGVRIRRSSSLGEKSDISINGMRGNAIRVYIDGLPMEFIYPNFDISTLPLSSIKRIDVFKGVLPVDVSTDAMGGAINIITEQKWQSHLRASYSIGSFNTHMADVELGLANKKNYFISANVAYNYSDNNYKMKALVYETNKQQTVRRFHDAYEMFFGSVNFGVHSKKWADELRFTVNYATGFKEMQNGARISTFAIGEAKYTSANYSFNARYEKTLLKDRLKLNAIFNYSLEDLDFVDTTANVYSWSGKVVDRFTHGEYSGESYYTTHFKNFISRTTLAYDLHPNHKLLFSDLFGRQELTGKDYLREENSPDYLAIPQYLNKNIAGLQYDGQLLRKFLFSVAVKRFDFVLDGVENNTFIPIKKEDGFWGWNAGLKYDLSEKLFVRASYERGFLIPLFQQFVGNGADIVRNTNLLPESSDNVNLGISWKTSLGQKFVVNVTANSFLRQQYDIIFLGNSVVRRYENADDVNTLGVETDWIVTYANTWTLRGSITSMQKEFSHLKDPRNAFLEKADFPNNPTFFGNSELSWQKARLFRSNDTFRAYIFYQYVAPFNHMLIGQNDTYKNSPDSFVPRQQRVDLGCSYKFAKPGITTALNVNNLLNAELYDNFRVPRAGTNFNLKLIFEIAKL